MGGAEVSNRFAQELKESLGPLGVLSGADAQPFLVDQRNKFRGSALAVVKPASTEEVAEVVRRCHKAGVVVVTQGGNTGLSGGATPINEQRSSILLSLARMNAVESVNTEQWTATVQAGATVQAVQEAARDADRLFAPDWGARGTATIGGAIATDAGGINVLRYGNMRDQILGLEAVLPDGRVWDGLRALRKDSSGYDLKHLFIGSEGTLGIVTRAVLKLRPPTPHQQSAMAALSHLDELMAFYALANEVAPDVVTAFELVPDVGMNRVCEVFGLTRPISTVANFYVLLKLASSKPVTETLTELLDCAAERGLITDAVLAGSPHQEEQLWMMRDELPPNTLYPATQAAGLKMDTAVPIDRMGEYHDTVRDIAAELVPEAMCYGFGHVGDGNLHMMVLPTEEHHVPGFKARKAELQSRIDAATFALGGTLSAEHGVGQELNERIGGQKPDVEWDMMRTVKSAFDPENLMNPGKTLPEPR